MFKNLLITLLGTLVVGLLSLNVANLTQATVHDLLFKALSSLPSAGPLPNSPTAKQQHLAKTITNLKTANHGLQTQAAALKAENQELQTKIHHRARKVDAISRRIARRLVRNTAMNVSSLPAGAIPWVGTTLVVSVTAMDVKDACDTLADINAIARALEFDEHRSEAATICGYRVKTKEDVFDTIGGTLYHLIH